MPPRVPRSYDEIVRATVPDPDSSFRPTEQQQRQAFEGFRALDADEQELFDRIERELAASGHERQHVRVEVARDTVTLHGSVASAEALAQVVDLVRDIDGVGEVVDRLVVTG